MAIPTVLAIRVAVIMVLCFGYSLAATNCGLTIAQPNPSCSFSSTPCRGSPNTVMYPLAAGEDYNSLYSWILSVLGKDGDTVNMTYVNKTTTDPNVYFKNVDANTNCYLNLTFVYEVASFRNNMGYFKFSNATRSVIGGNHLVFNESSVDCQSYGSSCLPPGSTVLTIGPFKGNESVGFFLQQNQVCGGTNIFYSLDNLNTPQSNWNPIPKTGRMVAVLRDPNTQRVYFGCEDYPNGDQDYNDNIYSLSSSCPLDYSKWPCVNVCRNALQDIDMESCTCYCPSKNTTVCPGATAYNDSICGCQCPSVSACSGYRKWNNVSCQCECPATAAAAGATCKPHQVWNTTSCSCVCLPTASAANVTCPNIYYQWDTTACGCSCPTSAAAAGTTCSGQTRWDTTACNCTCPSSGSCSGNFKWVQDNDPSVCGCQCPSSGTCQGNYVWNSTRDVCDCFCPFEAPTPCPGNFVWNRTVCDCFCPLEPPSGNCNGVLVWDRDSCTCTCPDDDPCVNDATACKQYQCNDNTGNCDLVYVDTCASQRLQFNATGCLAWSCDDQLGCVRSANGSCCGNNANCTLCAKADGCDWVNNQCVDSGQVLTSPLEPVDHPDCFPSSGLTAGETAGITVGVVAGVSVGVGGAAALLGAGYILYRLLNKPPPPEQLPTVENLDTEAGTDDNPLFHKNEVEMTNPMFSPGGGGGGGGGGDALFAQGGGASAVPADLHTL